MSDSERFTVDEVTRACAAGAEFRKRGNTACPAHAEAAGAIRRVTAFDGPAQAAEPAKALSERILENLPAARGAFIFRMRPEDIEAIGKEVAVLEARLRDAERRNRVAEEHINEASIAEDELDAMVTERDDLRARLASQEAETARVLRERDDWMRATERAQREQIEAAGKRLADAERAGDNLRAKLAETWDKLGDEKLRRIEYGEEFQRVSEERDDLRAKLADAEERLEAVKKVADGLDAGDREWLEKTHALEAKLTSLEHDSRVLTERVATRDACIAGLEASSAELAREKDEAKAVAGVRQEEILRAIARREDAERSAGVRVAAERERCLAWAEYFIAEKDVSDTQLRYGIRDGAPAPTKEP